MYPNGSQLGRAVGWFIDYWLSQLIGPQEGRGNAHLPHLPATLTHVAFAVLIAFVLLEVIGLYCYYCFVHLVFSCLSKLGRLVIVIWLLSFL